MFFKGRADHTDGAPEPPASAGQAVLRDDLSGLYQSWYFQLRAQEEITRCARYGRTFAVAVWELQLLPGEALPDEVIARCGEVIRSALRTSDLAAHLGRNEFAALLIEASFLTAKTVAHRVKSDLQTRIRGAGGTWRSGFAAFPDDGVEAAVLEQVALRRIADDIRPAA